MPSQQHEAILELFRNRPALAPELLRDALGVALPDYSGIRIESPDLTQIQPTGYRADLVVRLVTPDDAAASRVACSAAGQRWAGR